jgi:hypothetical protein
MLKRKTPRLGRGRFSFCAIFVIVREELLDQVNGFLDLVMGLINVLDGAHLESLSELVVFFLGNIVMGFVEQFQRTMQASAPIHFGVNGRMIVQILAIVDGGFFDFVDGFIDIVDGFSLLFLEFTAIGTLEMSARVPEIRECMQIRRMLARRRRHCGAVARDKKKQCGGRKKKLKDAFHNVIYPSFHQIYAFGEQIAVPRKQEVSLHFLIGGLRDAAWGSFQSNKKPT